MNTYAIVCCYGLFDESFRTKEEMQGLVQYNQAVIETIIKLRQESGLKAAVITGGYTQEGKPSESITNSIYIRDELARKEINDFPLYIETISHTTTENLVFGYTLIKDFNPEKIIIISDNHRKTKVQVEAKILFKSLGIELEFIALDRMDVHPASNYELQTHQHLPEEISSPYFQKLKALLE
ncbi:MAG: hypothetical protein OHK0017_06940 [Patescibacteria group bacterium]